MATLLTSKPEDLPWDEAAALPVPALARVRATRVIATAGPTSADRLKRLGVEAGYHYHDHDWPNAVHALTHGTGVPAAVSAAHGGEAATLFAVADGGRFATITGAPPKSERGVSIVDASVHALRPGRAAAR
jgi:NADPH:quinone reductase-like Zn-dependent oxidoreductase